MNFLSYLIKKLLAIGVISIIWLSMLLMSHKRDERLIAWIQLISCILLQNSINVGMIGKHGILCFQIKIFVFYPALSDDRYSCNSDNGYTMSWNCSSHTRCGKKDWRRIGQYFPFLVPFGCLFVSPAFALIYAVVRFQFFYFILGKFVRYIVPFRCFSSEWFSYMYIIYVIILIIITQYIMPVNCPDNEFFHLSCRQVTR